MPNTQQTKQPDRERFWKMWRELERTIPTSTTRDKHAAQAGAWAMFVTLTQPQHDKERA